MAESDKAVYAALAGNTAVAITKLVAAASTGSAGMLSEGLHSVVDAGNEILLLVGRRRSMKPPDEVHPFGHGQELYFWTLLVSLLIFTAGGAVSVYEGVVRVFHPEPAESSIWNYVVLGAAMLFEGTSFAIGFRVFRKEYPNQNLKQVIHSSKDPTIFTVIVEDIADLVGLAVALIGILLTDYLGNPIFDSLASIVIGLLLMSISVVLVRESKGLLTGEAASPEMRHRIHAILAADTQVKTVSPPLTMYFGPDTVLLAVKVEFRGHEDVAQVVDRLESAVRAEYPEVKRIFIEPGRQAESL